MKAALYCRLSEEDRNKLNKEDDSNSIQNQKTMLLQYADAKGWEVYDIYSDDDYTGSDRRRPEFNRLLEDAKAHKFEIVLCKTQSRFTRELELVEKYIHGLFPIWGIRFVSIVDNADTANKGNKKSRQINGLVNEWYLEDMSENIRSVLTNRRQNGLHIGSSALYGYRKDPEQKGHLIIDEEAAAVVREVFALYSQGYGKTAIARILNDRGVPNPAEYKKLHGLRCKQPKGEINTLWRYDTISAMLTNEIYIGNMVQGKYGSVSYKTKINRPRPKSEWIIVEGTHAPIIDRSLWDTVQKRIAEKAKPFASGQIGIFAKKTKCVYCGCTMRSCKNRGRHYLQCQTRYVSPNACPGAFIPVAELEEIVIQELQRLSGELLDKEELERNITLADNWACQKEKLHRDIAVYQKGIAQYTQCMKDLYLDKAKGTLRDEEFAAMSADFLAEKNRLEQQLKNLRQGLDRIEQRFSTGDSRKEMIAQYLNMEHLTREVVVFLIDHITIGHRDLETKRVPVDIYWNF